MTNFSKTNDRKLFRILVDLDNVMCDFESHFLKKWKEYFPQEPHLPLKDRRTFYLRDDYRNLAINDHEVYSLKL